MQTKLRLDICKPIAELSEIATVVSNHNAGVVPITLEDIMSWLQFRRAQYPSINEQIFAFKKEEKPNKLFITSDGGKSVCLIIEEIELNKLEEVGALA